VSLHDDPKAFSFKKPCDALEQIQLVVHDHYVQFACHHS
jgi:hypothetical protein